MQNQFKNTKHTDEKTAIYIQYISHHGRQSLKLILIIINILHIFRCLQPQMISMFTGFPKLAQRPKLNVLLSEIAVFILTNTCYDATKQLPKINLKRYKSRAQT